jgi:hypothetical protein
MNFLKNHFNELVTLTEGLFTKSQIHLNGYLYKGTCHSYKGFLVPPMFLYSQPKP